MPFTPQTASALVDIAVRRQVSGRVPGLAAGVSRAGTLQWSAGVGSADLSRPGEAPGEHTQYYIASNTKTFVAVVVLALRDEGRLDLDHDVTTYLPEAGHPGVTIRQMLSHSSGMQREPVGDVWDTLDFPDGPALVQGWTQARRVSGPHRFWHYSNLCYAMLGQVIERLDGRTWFDSVKARILDPLEMRETTNGLDPTAGRAAAGRYFVPPWSDVPRVEPDLHTLAMQPAGNLASTLADLARWGAFVADPVDEVLAPDTLEEMCEPQILSASDWSMAHGLGFMLFRRGARTWVGHTGSHPGHITALLTDRGTATSAAVLMNSSSSPSPAAFALDLGEAALEREPVTPEPWTPGTAVPEDLEPLLGPWFSEGQPFTLTVREGALHARADGAPAHVADSVFERVDTDTFRTVAGRERGELLRLRRDAAGEVAAFNWATYLFTRRPYAFGEWLED